MKKLLSLILACVLCVTAMSVTAFADAAQTPINDDGIFGMIIDPDGNIVEYLTMPRSAYVNKVVTIAAGNSLVSLQYQPTENFYFGFSSRDNGKVITDSRCKFEVAIELSNTIGAANKEEWHCEPLDYEGGGMYFRVQYDPRKYCNGVLKNTSSYDATVRILVLLNTDDDEVLDLLS